MRLVVAGGDVLEQILQESHGIWGDGLTLRGYRQYNLAQLRTPWGADRLCRYALLDERGTVLTSAKRYYLRARVEGREVDAVGLGAVYTPERQRGRGYAASIVNRLVADASARGVELALLFSEIGTDYYERLGFVPVERRELLMSVAEKAGAPMALVRTGEERDIPAVAALAESISRHHRFAIGQSEDFIRFGLSRKRLLAGLLPPGSLTVEFFIVEEGTSAVAFAILTTAGDDVVLEMCADRDATGARVGALLQVLRARTPSERALKMRGSLPPDWLPPQLRIEASATPTDVLMVKPLGEGVLSRPLEHADVLYWHGDLL
ncbi:MAG: GNAT family N-acetyltransferase [Vicinamibacterales bacterium]